jgi:hypothetical protein
MEFIYANELKQKFSVYGHFYDLEIGGTIFKCRSVLEILSKSENLEPSATPCAVVVMMNPGSSRPVDADYVPKRHSVWEVTSGDWKKHLVPTRPDNAQYQIMRLMLLKGWTYVRVLNLSDLRNGNSGNFSVDFAQASELDSSSPHSLTHVRRLQELESCCADSPIVIAAWGATEVLREAAGSFLSKIKVRGLSMDYPWYRYPSPYRKDQKIEWLRNAREELEA